MLVVLGTLAKNIHLTVNHIFMEYQLSGCEKNVTIRLENIIFVA